MFLFSLFTYKIFYHTNHKVNGYIYNIDQSGYQNTRNKYGMIMYTQDLVNYETFNNTTKKKERKQYLNQFHSTIYIRSHNN